MGGVGGPTQLPSRSPAGMPGGVTQRPVSPPPCVTGLQTAPDLRHPTWVLGLHIWALAGDGAGRDAVATVRAIPTIELGAMAPPWTIQGCAIRGKTGPGRSAWLLQVLQPGVDGA